MWELLRAAQLPIYSWFRTCRWMAKNLYLTYKKPFDAIAKGLNCPNWLPGWDDFRTADWVEIIQIIQHFDVLRQKSRLLLARAA